MKTPSFLSGLNSGTTPSFSDTFGLPCLSLTHYFSRLICHLSTLMITYSLHTSRDLCSSGITMLSTFPSFLESSCTPPILLSPTLTTSGRITSSEPNTPRIENCFSSPESPHTAQLMRKSTKWLTSRSSHPPSRVPSDSSPLRMMMVSMMPLA